MYNNDIITKLERFLKEKILPYYDVLTIAENNDDESGIIKEVLLSLVADDYYKNSLKDTIELHFYGTQEFDLKDLDKLRPALINRLVSYGMPKSILEQYSTSELLLMYFNYYIFDKHKASIRQIIEILKLFNLNVISIAELYINFDKNANEPYFIPEWIYNPLSLKISRLNYDEIYNSTPGFLIDKDTIIQNKDKIIFPVKTNILYIASTHNKKITTIEYLKAAYVAYIMQNRYITIELPIDTLQYENININDIPVILYYITLRYYDTEYIDSSEKQYQNLVYQLPRLFQIIERDPEQFVKQLNRFSNFNELKNSNELYTLREELKQFLKNITYDTYLDNTQNILSRQYLESYIKHTYPKLYKDIDYIFTTLRQTNNDEFLNKLTLLLSEIFSKFLAEFYKVHSTYQNIDITYFISYINFFFRYGIELLDVFTLIIKKYFLLVKFFLPAYIHLSQNLQNASFIIYSHNNSLYMYSQSIAQMQYILIDFLPLTRYKTYQEISLIEFNRFEIIDTPPTTITKLPIVDKKIDVTDKYQTVIKTNRLSHFIIRNYTETNLRKYEIYRFSYFDIETTQTTKKYYDLFLYLDKDKNSVSINWSDYNKYSEQNSQIDKINNIERYAVYDQINIVVA
jgi:hypothetical protein